MWAAAQAMNAPSVVHVRGISKHCDPDDPTDVTYVCEVVNDDSVIWQNPADLHPLESAEDWLAFKEARRLGKIVSAEKLIARLKGEEPVNPLEGKDQP